MATYTKETALYDTGAIAGGISDASETASKYITAVDQNGIKVHAESNPTTNYTQINANGMSIYQNVDGTATEVASFGADGAQVGSDETGHTIVDSNGMKVYGGDGSQLLAQIGYGDGLNPSGLAATAPYYTLGDRSSNNPAVGNYSVSVGHANIATGFCAYADGWGNTSTGLASHAEGHGSFAIGDYSHAGGGGYASGEGSFAFGLSVHAESDYQTVIGKYNTPDSNNVYCFIIGNGRSGAPYTSNALTVDWSGNLVTSGGATINDDVSITGSLNATGSITQNSNALFQIETVTCSVTYSAGTIGTRGTTASIGTTVKTGYTYLGATVIDHQNSSTFACYTGVNPSNNSGYLACYRASTGAASNLSVVVRKFWVLSSLLPT